MKFQNPSLLFFLNGRTNGRTDKRTSRKQYAPHFFKVGGIKITRDFKPVKGYPTSPSASAVVQNI